MFKPYQRERIELTEEQKDLRALAEWVWNSHFWIEHQPGYYRCEWCGTYHTSLMPMHMDFSRICMGNPIIKKLCDENN